MMVEDEGYNGKAIAICLKKPHMCQQDTMSQEHSKKVVAFS